jgi:Ulp1 family protease
LTKIVNSNSIKDKWNNTWKRLIFPINVYNNHWILIVVDKIVKQVMVFDSLAMSNQCHEDKVLTWLKQWSREIEEG